MHRLKRFFIPLILAVVVLILIGFGIRSPKLTENSPVHIESRNAFIVPKESTKETPDLRIIEKNSLMAASPPIVVTPQVLGALIEGYGFGEERRTEIVEYIVEPGDNLSSIAMQFNISLNTILWANDLHENSVLQLGQKLVILPVSGVLYLVRSGDTLSEITETYKGEVKEILAFNGLGDENIFAGDVLIIPNGKMPVRIARIALIPVGNSYFIFPCEGRITQGPHGPFRNAVDIANKCGKPVVAAAGGTILRAGPINIGGNRITILHPNGVVTYYGHLSTILVAQKQKVDTGDIIGYIGNTGYTLGATGCHLHFEVNFAQNFLNEYSVGSYLIWKK